jgi:hypothetical protein
VAAVPGDDIVRRWTGPDLEERARQREEARRVVLFGEDRDTDVTLGNVSRAILGGYTDWNPWPKPSKGWDRTALLLDNLRLNGSTFFDDLRRLNPEWGWMDQPHIFWWRD